MTSQGRLHEVIRDRLTMIFGAGPTTSWAIEQIYKAAEEHAEERAAATRCPLEETEIRERIGEIRIELKGLVKEKR